MSHLIRKGTSPAMAAANRTNALKSTGPTTEHGRAMVRANPGKHWGRAETIRELMPALGESPAEFDQVREGLYNALRPRDAFEASVARRGRAATKANCVPCATKRHIGTQYVEAL